MEDNIGFGATLGVIISIFAFFFIWHFFESTCQVRNDAADCEWSRTPFTPVAPETTE